ncbi:MAG: putative dsRNA-binding protein [Oscillospiraceae bacterium]|nr:putative dsRNA-binding protein [Oscillospiraceae bacterium]
MDAKDLTFIQNQIGYSFDNEDLLEQAFVRKSWSHENGGEDNEVLEFIGDKVLDLVVVKLLAEAYGCTGSQLKDYNPEEDWDEFVCQYGEKELTELKSQLVRKSYLARRVDEMGLADYLIMGKCDITQHVEQQPSVKEDLFEAILGAVALDCQWDLPQLQDAAEQMLQPEDILDDGEDCNYVAEIQEWCSRATGGGLWFFYGEERNNVTTRRGVGSMGGIGNILIDRQEKAGFFCELQDAGDITGFRGHGKSKREARKDACQKAFEWLEKNGRLFSIQDELENPNPENAIGQLETLARRGYFSLPVYEFKQGQSGAGSPIWSARCSIKEAGVSFHARSSSKREAKNAAAYQMLRYVLKEF